MTKFILSSFLLIIFKGNLVANESGFQAHSSASEGAIASAVQVTTAITATQPQYQFDEDYPSQSALKNIEAHLQNATFRSFSSQANNDDVAKWIKKQQQWSKENFQTLCRYALGTSNKPGVFSYAALQTLHDIAFQILEKHQGNSAMENVEKTISADLLSLNTLRWVLEMLSSFCQQEIIKNLPNAIKMTYIEDPSVRLQHHFGISGTLDENGSPHFSIAVRAQNARVFQQVMSFLDTFLKLPGLNQLPLASWVIYTLNKNNSIIISSLFFLLESIYNNRVHYSHEMKFFQTEQERYDYLERVYRVYLKPKLFDLVSFVPYIEVLMSGKTSAGMRSQAQGDKQAADVALMGINQTNNNIMRQTYLRYYVGLVMEGRAQLQQAGKSTNFESNPKVYYEEAAKWYRVTLSDNNLPIIEHLWALNLLGLGILHQHINTDTDGNIIPEGTHSKVAKTLFQFCIEQAKKEKLDHKVYYGNYAACLLGGNSTPEEVQEACDIFKGFIRGDDSYLICGGYLNLAHVIEMHTELTFIGLEGELITHENRDQFVIQYLRDAKTTNKTTQLINNKKLALLYAKNPDVCPGASASEKHSTIESLLNSQHGNVSLQGYKNRDALVLGFAAKNILKDHKKAAEYFKNASLSGDKNAYWLYVDALGSDITKAISETSESDDEFDNSIPASYSEEKKEGTVVATSRAEQETRAQELLEKQARNAQRKIENQRLKDEKISEAKKIRFSATAKINIEEIPWEIEFDDKAKDEMESFTAAQDFRYVTLIQAIINGSRTGYVKLLTNLCLKDDDTPIGSARFTHRDRMIFTKNKRKITVYGFLGHDDTIERMKRQGIAI